MRRGPWLRYERLLAFALMGISFGALADAQDLGKPSSSASGPGSPNTSATLDPNSRVDFTLYLWFPGTHGTMGANGRDVDFRATPGDLLSNTRFGLMGAVDVQHRRFVLFTDLNWVRLEAYNQPFPRLPQFTVEVKANQFLLNPEAGYRFIDSKKIKIDALWGVRYWHLDSNLRFTPSLTGANFSGTRDWVDPLMGARFQIPFSQKLVITILGDGGGWGAASQLDYQILGAAQFKVSSRFALGVGYRYLYVNYRPGNFVWDTALSGAIAGVTYTFKQ